jgi:chromosome segregation ATPase
MSVADVDIQLKVWKDLAVSKQILMSTATKALGLDAECSSAELKEALQKAIQRANEADANILQTREKAEKEVAEMKQLVSSSDAACVAAEEKVTVAEEAREVAERQMTIGRETNADAIKKARAEVAEHQNKLKAISKALSDTPENVVKKLKTLKKQKMDEAKLRTQTEKSLKTLQKEKSALDADLEEKTALLEKTGALVEEFRTLHALCKDQNKKIKSLSEDKKDLFKIPDLDEELLESLAPAKAD